MTTSSVIAGVIFVLVLVLIIDGCSSPVAAQYHVTIHTDNYAYVIGTPVRITGTVSKSNNTIASFVPVIVGLRQIDKTSFGFLTSSPQNQTIAAFPVSAYTVTGKDGSYNVILTPPPQPGHYSVEAATSTKEIARVVIEVQELFFTRTAYMLYTGGAIGFGGLIAVMYAYRPSPHSDKESEAEHLRLESDTEKRHNRLEALRFIFLSILAFTPIAAFALTDVQIAPNSPFGLIIKQNAGLGGFPSSNSTLAGSQWMVNIGGVPPDYKSGIQIPVNVFIFGILGGYLRFLYYTSQKDASTVEEDADDVFHATLKDLALFLLSPLLAMAVWLVLFQGGTTSILTLAAVSFTVGLVTKEVVQALIDFVKSRVSQPTPGAASPKSSISGFYEKDKGSYRYGAPF
jgi:hypothetical protein